VLASLVATPAAFAATGGTAYDDPKATSAQTEAQVDLPEAVIGPDGLAIAPQGAPVEVVEAIEAANRIVGKPYKYGGGHAKVEDRGYDCSGTVSYALIGAKLLKAPLDSRGFRRWGVAGPGAWITVYTNPSHAFAVIAGLRLDTSAAGDPSGAKGPRWRPALRSTKGFRARHPRGL
jgi:hypothetical protein